MALSAVIQNESNFRRFINLTCCLSCIYKYKEIWGLPWIMQKIRNMFGL